MPPRNLLRAFLAVWILVVGLMLLTIAIAFAVHTALGQFRGDLLVYGAVVLFVAIHGPLTATQYGAAVSRRRN